MGRCVEIGTEEMNFSYDIWRNCMIYVVNLSNAKTFPLHIGLLSNSALSSNSCFFLFGACDVFVVGDQAI